MKGKKWRGVGFLSPGACSNLFLSPSVLTELTECLDRTHSGLRFQIKVKIK